MSDEHLDHQAREDRFPARPPLMKSVSDLVQGNLRDQALDEGDAMTAHLIEPLFQVGVEADFLVPEVGNHFLLIEEHVHRTWRRAGPGERREQRALKM